MDEVNLLMRELPIEIQAKAWVNIFNRFNKVYGVDSLTSEENKNFLSMSISSCFSWAGSVEGSSFWRDMSRGNFHRFYDMREKEVINLKQMEEEVFSFFKS